MSPARAASIAVERQARLPGVDIAMVMTISPICLPAEFVQVFDAVFETKHFIFDNAYYGIDYFADG